MLRKDTRPLTINGSEWEFKIGKNTVAIYDPKGKRYFVKFKGLIAEDLYLAGNYQITPSLISNYIKMGILDNIWKPLKTQTCSMCGEKKDDVVLQTNPYGQELYDDDTEDFYCNDCIEQSASDV